jgi:hypothetical protein
MEEMQTLAANLACAVPSQPPQKECMWSFFFGIAPLWYEPGLGTI